MCHIRIPGSRSPAWATTTSLPTGGKLPCDFRLDNGQVPVHMSGRNYYWKRQDFSQWGCYIRILSDLAFPLLALHGSVKLILPFAEWILLLLIQYILKDVNSLKLYQGEKDLRMGMPLPSMTKDQRLLQDFCLRSSLSRLGKINTYYQPSRVSTIIKHQC